MELKEETKDINEIFKRLKKRDFSGNTGQAVKNSSYTFSKTIFSKVGSIIFTVILARVLLPELFGLYSLTFSTLVFFSLISDLGISNALVNFVSKAIGKGDYPKAKGYFLNLFKIKIYLTILSTVIILASAYFVSVVYYGKPIFYALVVGAFYVAVVSIMTFLEFILVSENKFKMINKKEIIFQLLRLAGVPIFVVLLMRTSLSGEGILTAIFALLTIINLLVIFYVYFYLRKHSVFMGLIEKKLNQQEKIRLKKFLIPIFTMSLSGILFGYIDIIMLGHFVRGEFIAYYSIAFNLASSAGLILGFSAIALFPIFSRLSKTRLNEGFRKSRRIVLLFSTLGAIALFFIAKPLILLVYGIEYFPAIYLLRLFSVILITEPIISLYNTYYMSQERTQIVAVLLISTTILNIILNYWFISNGLKIGMLAAVEGACYATILSKIAYLVGIGITKSRN
ncbi:MAG: oligosaccharide flippase family protein [archaeon]|nr:oligosaccharide flippase family protein [archaeon]